MKVNTFEFKLNLDSRQKFRKGCKELIFFTPKHSAVLWFKFFFNIEIFNNIYNPPS